MIFYAMGILTIFCAISATDSTTLTFPRFQSLALVYPQMIKELKMNKLLPSQAQIAVQVLYSKE
jgi:hypothetical protein